MKIFLDYRNPISNVSLFDAVVKEIQYSRLCYLQRTGVYFLTIPEAGKSKVKVPASSEGLSASSPLNRDENTRVYKCWMRLLCKDLKPNHHSAAFTA